MADLSRNTELRRSAGVGDPGVRDAIRTGVGISVAALVFLFVADMWNGTCTGSLTQAIGCTPSQQAALTFGAPAILLAGGIWSVARGLRVRAGHSAMAWQVAGWTLLTLAVACAVLSLPSLPGR
ncbi:hypothetical protein KUF57_24630 [Mycolicibacterium sp. PAM1]|uniref:hypothetical protein n=1 Tax=Mycolicibacterium sp. PAM1 TaxID=2853535 RepID=UPI001C3E1F0D|nr:hypothetical protein [Mycolicibacterium sp. PAM1]MBV5246722.1 hypothetical protein [Mycolicibacterium sp. PAM1]